MISTQKQHFVPQFLLRNFSNEKQRIDVFDRTTGVVTRRAVKKVAHEPGLYDFVDDNNADDSLEPRFGKFESRTAGLLRKINATERGSDLGDEDRKFLVSFIAMQLLRVRKLRSYFELIAGYRQSVILSEKGLQFTIFKGPDDPRRAHISFLSQHTGTIGAALSALVPAILVATGERPFIISDNPVVIYSTIGAFDESDLGVHLHKSFLPHSKISNILAHFESRLSDSLTDAYLPISPHICLLLASPRVARGASIAGFERIELGDDQVEALNLLQMLSSDKHIFGRPDSLPSLEKGKIDVETGIRECQRLLLVEHFLIRRVKATRVAKNESVAWHYEPLATWGKE